MASEVVEQVLNGLAVSLSYLLIVAGYYLTFTVLRVANLAYSAVFMIGAVAAALLAETGLWSPLAALGGVVLAIVVGVAVHLVAVAPLGRVERVDSQAHLAVLASTSGAALLIQFAVVMVIGSGPRIFPLLLEGPSFAVGPTLFSAALTANLLASLSVLFGVMLLVRRSRFGLRLRALSADRELAEASGVRVQRDQLLCVALSCGLAGLAGILVSQQIGAVSVSQGLTYGLKGLIALIVGRTATGAALVALLMGFGETAAIAFGAGAYRDLLTFGSLVLAITASGWSRR
jgi:branched-chain amino acid transport system permease protein